MPDKYRKQRQKRKTAYPSHSKGRRSDDDCSGGWQRSKVKGRNSRATSVFAHENDVTLGAFADNACGQALAGRISKAAAMSVSKEIKRVESASAILAATTEEEIIDNWYERTFSDDDDEGSDEQGEDGQEEGAGIQSMMEEGDHREGQHGNVQREEGMLKTSLCTAAYIYPSVIWYLVSSFIYPEDIATFARLCRDTYALTNTAGFWRKLYFRYHNSDSARKLPKELHPTSIQRTFGLRSLVIRSLQFLYPPFAERNFTRQNALHVFTSGGESIEKIAGMVFMYHVSKRKGGNHIYYLKFHRLEPRDCSTLNAIEALNRDPDIHVNKHHAQCILMVICKQTHHLEPERIMGKELVRASVGVSSGMSYNRLKLEFREKTCVVLDPIVCLRVFHWWHPSFLEEFRTSEGSVPVNYNLNIWNGT